VASFASDITVGGVINNTYLSNKLSNKSSKISTAPASIVLGQSADIVYFVNENSVSYPLVSSNDISFSRNNNNILLNITQAFKDLYVLSSSLSSTLSSYITSSGLTSALSSYAPLANPTFTGTVSGITKAMVGLSECRQYERCFEASIHSITNGSGSEGEFGESLIHWNSLRDHQSHGRLSECR
jgi:hypothetical protein